MEQQRRHNKIEPSGKPFTVLFRTDANPRIGFGHLSRCLSLAGALLDNGGKAVFLFGEKTGGISESRMGGHPFYLAPKGAAFQDEADYIAENIPVVPDAVVLDAAHPDTRGNLSGFENLLQRLSKGSFPVALIDASGVQALRTQLASLPVHLVIAPYAGEKENNGPRPYRILAGPAYFVLGQEYKGIPKRMIRTVADRILVTCGGADPAGITLQILSALSQLHKPIQTIRIIVGPLFSMELSATIRGLAANIHHRVEILKAPVSLLSHMLWCDIAIATSGLTKYELAATGTPSILLSPDLEHDEINRPFATLGTAKDLGVHNAVSPEALSDEIERLSHDSRKRRMMSEKGQKLLDGRGAFRILSELRKLHDAKL